MTAACDSPLEVAKERIRIPDLWRELGLEGEPKKTCRCPFHEDRSPSFSIFDDGKGGSAMPDAAAVASLTSSRRRRDLVTKKPALRFYGALEAIGRLSDPSDQGGSPPCWNFRPWCHTPRK